MPDPSLLEVFPTPTDSPFVVEHVSDDEKHRTEVEVQKLHDDFIEQINNLVTAKEAEIMEV